MMKFFITLLIFFSTVTLNFAQSAKVQIVKAENDMKITVNGNDFMINGMNWDYLPIGTNYSYSIWKEPDPIVKAALDEEMSLLKNMGVNSIRVYTGIPSKWIKYIYENYGIYTMLNHSFGRYGLNLNGDWVANTEYSDERVKKLLLEEVKQMVSEYKDTPGLLLFLLGNENNYGLFWEGAETENIPVEDRKSTRRARSMYKLFNEATASMKGISTQHPIGICNGDLLFLDIIAEECKDIDIFGTNMYRGVSFGNAFDEVKHKLGKPILFTEFGSDAYNANIGQEAQQDQAYYLINNWQEIYENAAGLGKSGNSIGGYTFQFSDGWWKFGQTKNLDIHDTNASWANGGYLFDYQEGQNNMNEEWFGICAKGPTNDNGLYQLYPRAAYFVLKEVHKLNPYKIKGGIQGIRQYFSNIQLVDATLQARGQQAALEGKNTQMIRLSSIRADMSTFNTGGSLITTPDKADPNKEVYPNKKGFDHMQSFYIGVEANPAPNVRANVDFNILGNVAQNPIDEVFYENRGRPVEVITPDGKTTLNSINRIQVYKADVNWDSKLFDMSAFYRTGHYHWGYEGDFFGLYPEANYGTVLDMYNGEIIGTEIVGKQIFDGLKLAFGPQLWWGANPALLLKYSKQIRNINITAIYHEDLDDASDRATSSFAIPLPKTRRVTLALQRKIGKLGVELGGIWSGNPLVGRKYQFERDGKVYDNKIKDKDTWGTKAKITYTGDIIKWYVQGAAMGLVANGGTDYTQTFAGWKLKDSGSGNQYNFLTGAAYNIGNFQIAPNFLWQKPIEGPIPGDVLAPGRARNVIDDPFAVRINREMTAGELLLTYDPTPATWMYDWDSDIKEDATLAVSVGFIYRHLPTTQDAAIGIMPDGRTTFAFPGAAPAKDLWEVNTRAVSRINPNFGFIANFYGGTGQANGNSARTIHRYGADLRAIYKKVKFATTVKFNDWGPYDYHRDFNLTFPFQFVADISTTAGKPSFLLLPNTRFGVRWTWRSLDQHSPRYAPTYAIDNAGQWLPDPTAIGFDKGSEWEFRTYIQINIGR